MDKSVRELVSIVIPAYNQSRYISFTLDSVFNQSYPHIEVIVVDDGSTDNTESICQSYMHRHPGMIYHRQKNQGPSAARNCGVRLSKGEYIIPLDADDMMDPRRVELELNVFREDSLVDVMYSAINIINAEGDKVGEVRSQDYAKEDLIVHLLFRNVIPPTSLMARRECFVRYPYNEKIRHAEDYEFILRLADGGYRFKYLDLPLTYYRRHATNLSNDLEAHAESEFTILKGYMDRLDDIIGASRLNNEEKMLYKGKILFKMHQWDEALQIFQRVPKPISLFYEGNCYLQMNENEEAINAYRKSLEGDLSNPACYNNLGVAWSRQGDWEKADRNFLKALELQPDYLDAKDNLAVLRGNKEGRVRMTMRELRPQLIQYNRS